MHLLLKFGRKVFVLLNAKLTLIKGGGAIIKKIFILMPGGQPWHKYVFLRCPEV